MKCNQEKKIDVISIKKFYLVMHIFMYFYLKNCSELSYEMQPRKETRCYLYQKVSFIWLGVFLCTVFYNTSVSADAGSELRTAAVYPSTVRAA